MTNQDYQSSKWTNGEYTIEWDSERKVRITRHSSQGDEKLVINSFSFTLGLDRILFPNRAFSDATWM